MKEIRPASGFSRSSGIVLFQNIQRVAMVKLHAHRAQDGTHGARRSALFADHLAHIRRSHTQAQHSIFIPGYSLHFDCLWIVNQSFGYLCYQLLHIVVIQFLHHHTGLKDLTNAGLSQQSTASLMRSETGNGLSVFMTEH
jgi:hypothetical protein